MTTACDCDRLRDAADELHRAAYVVAMLLQQQDGRINMDDPSGPGALGRLTEALEEYSSIKETAYLQQAELLHHALGHIDSLLMGSHCWCDPFLPNGEDEPCGYCNAVDFEHRIKEARER